MFTGIVESIGVALSISEERGNKRFRVASAISRELKVDQSVSHNGVCLTVVEANESYHEVIAIQETLDRSNLGALNKGDELNLERCMLANGRFDGHIVQGHVDQTAFVTRIQEQNGSWLFDFEYDPGQENITVEKGSICVNGVSLTCFNSKNNGFRVAIIPYTFDNTNFHFLKLGDLVNLEFDIVGKYIKKLLATS
ncbi:MAG TPA: riboflavin synthase [Cyclobacteriaceae bacterium]|nr:riboflavin synthase [Cyclobacteriaceae bacterium]